MVLLFAILLTLPQDYVNLVMTGKYDEAIKYCDEMILKNKNPYEWKLEEGDIYYNKLFDFGKAAQLYQDAVDNYKQKNGWAYYRLAQVLEMKEDFLNAARMYEIVATRFRKAPLDSFSLTGVERCFKKNYQDYVATVDGYNITRLELDEKTGRSGPSAGANDSAMLDQMIIERLIYTSALANDVMATDFFKDNIKTQSRNLLLEEVSAYEVILKSTPTEKQLKKYYESNMENYKTREQITGKEIVVASDSLARALIDSLRKDISSFDTLAKLYSTEPTARSGGNMGILYRGRKPATVDTIIFKTAPNSLTDIINFDGKYGIYYVMTYKPEQYRSFDEVKKQVEAQVRNENIKKQGEAFDQSLKKKAKLVTYQDSIYYVLKDTTLERSDVVLGQVNGRIITWADVKTKTELMGPQFSPVDLTKPDKVEELLNTIYNEELKLELAWRNKYFLHDGYFVQLKDAIKAILDQGLYKKIVVDAVVIDSQEVADTYTKDREEFKVPESARAKEIVLDSREKADMVHKLLKANPQAFDSLATVYSTGPSSVRGGETGLIRKGMMGPEYDKVLFGLKVGEISNVFSSKENVWTIIKMVEYSPEHYRSFDEVRNMIEARLRREKQGEIASAYLKKMREEADIKIFLQAQEETPEQKTQGEE